LRQARWVAARMQRALPVRHFHVVFTLPAELRPLVREHEVALLDLLFAAASETILELGRDPKRLGALCGVTGVVHTWGRNLSFHPHLHCIVTAGGLGPDGAWVDTAEKYLLPVKVMATMFRGKYLAGVARLFTDGKLAPGPRRATGLAVSLAQPGAFARLKDALYRKNWNVYAKAPFGTPSALFRYLGQYTHRVAISNHRLRHVDDDEIVFRTRGKEVCRLPPLEFMRRFLQHVLPGGFVKIRHFGLLAAGNVNTKLAVAREALDQRRRGAAIEPPPPSTADIPSLDWRALFLRLTGVDLGQCPDCGGELIAEALHDTPRAARAPPPESS
jgi:hypothetical protein